MAVEETQKKDITPKVTPKVVVKEADPVSGPELSEKTKAEMKAGREALNAHAK